MTPSSSNTEAFRGFSFHEEDWGPSQWQWLKSSEPYSLLHGGFGSGKSTVGIAKILLLKAENGRLPGLVIAQTFGSLFANIVDPMLELTDSILPAHLRPRLVGRNGGRPMLVWPDGCKIHLRSAEKPGGFDGLTVAWLYGDEIRHWRRKAYDIAISRVRIRGATLGQRAFTSTPDMVWMRDEWHKPGRERIRCPTRENASNLPDDYIPNLQLSYSARLQKVLLEGIFAVLEGAVYEQLDPDFWNSQHVIDFDPAEARNLRTYLAVDPGYRRSAWCWIAETKPLEWVVYDEMMPDNQSDALSVQQVNARKHPIDEIWCDPAADATQSAYNLDTITMLQDVKARTRSPICYIDGPFRSIEYGVDKMRTLFGAPEIGQPIRLRFARRLQQIEDRMPRGIVRSHLAYRYPDEKDGHALRAQPLKDGVNDHACLVGSEQIWIDGEGWTPLDHTDGLRNARVLTPAGLADLTAAGLTRKRAQIFEVELADGQVITATGDHRLLVAIPSGRDGHAPVVSWATVLEMRALLLAAKEGRRPGVSAPGGMDCGARQDTEAMSRPPSGWRQEQQHGGEPRSPEWMAAPVGSRETDGPRTQDHQSSPGRSEEVARLGRWARMAPEAWTRILAQCRADGVYLPRVWQALHDASTSGREVLPPELQGHCSTEASRRAPIVRVQSIREAGLSDVWCASVPSQKAFVLASGVVSHNCDALRYFGVGMFLTTRLRDVDARLREMAGNRAGFRRAA